MNLVINGTTQHSGRRRSRRLRALGVASAVAGAVALVTGVVYAFLSTNGGGSGSATTGSVSLGSPVSTTCTLANMAPGDPAGTKTCSLGVTYTGSLPAYMSLTVVVQSAAGSGGTKLYNGSNTSGLTMSISDGHHYFTVPTGAGTTGGTCPAGRTCWTASNDLAAAYSGSTPNLTFANGNTATFTVTPLFAKTHADNGFQGGTATVTLTAQAVQTAANPLPSSCTTSTIGQPCTASAPFTWS